MAGPSTRPCTCMAVGRTAALAAFATVVITVLAIMLTHHLGQTEGFERAPQAGDTIAIADAYVHTLDRYPTDSEVAAIRARLRRDPGYSVGVLETQLMMSPERERRVATQTNALKTELEGLYTRAQVRLHVRSVYQDHVGTDPSPEAELFLLRRYVEAGMDEHELLRLVKAIAIVPVAGNPMPFGVSRSGARPSGARRSRDEMHVQQ